MLTMFRTVWVWEISFIERLYSDLYYLPYLITVKPQGEVKD